MTTEQQLIKKNFIKRNKQSRANFLKSKGFKSIEAYIKSLEIPDSQVVKLSKTALAAKFLNSEDVEIEVSFNKNWDKNGLELLIAHYPTKFSRSDLAKYILDGVERIAKVKHSGVSDIMGRLYLVNLDEELDKTSKSDNRMILIGLDRINWFKVGNVTYKLKK